MINVCYIDAAVRNNSGHHANACRHFVGEFRRRGFVVRAFGNRTLDVNISAELQVEPFFRHYPYTRLKGGANLAYLIERWSFLDDLNSVWRRGPFDLVFAHSVMAAQLAAMALWLRTFEPDEMPYVAIGFDMPSGNDVSGYWNYLPPFYRKAGRLFTSRHMARTMLFTFNQVMSSDYAELLKLPVHTMPAVHAGLCGPRLRKRNPDGFINVAFLGHQRREKGYHLIPEIVRKLMDRHLPVTFLVQNSESGDDPISRELRVRASACPHLIFVEKAANQFDWQELLDRSDLIILPYEPKRYRESGSAVAEEAISDGIPMVVPAGTTMENLAMAYQGASTSFLHWDSDEVASAIERAVARFEFLARRAETGAMEWRRANGVQLFVDRLLEVAQFGKSLPDIKSRSQPVGDGLRRWLLDRAIPRLVD